MRPRWSTTGACKSSASSIRSLTPLGVRAARSMGGVEIVAADHDHGHAVAPAVVDRHRGVLQADGAVAEGHQRLARDLEVAVAHGDGGFLVRAGQEFGLLVAAVVDERFM